MTANQLQAVLDRHKLSQRKAAKEMGIHERTMRKYCAGDLEIPRVVEMAVLYLLGEQRDAKQPSE